MRELLGTDSPPLRRFAVVWAGLAGWVLSATFFLLFVRSAGMLLLIAVVPGLLSAAAVHRATRRSKDAAGAIIGLSVGASIVCPFAIGGLGLLVSLVTGPMSQPELVLVGVLVGGAVGAFFAAPLGLLFGTIYAIVWRRLDATRASGRASLEQAWRLFGVGFVVLGGLVLLAAALVPAPSLRWSAPDLLVPLGTGTLLFGLLTAARGVVMGQRRRLFVRRVRRGDLPGWCIVDSSEVKTSESLPRLFADTGAQVLVRRHANERGPFRSTEIVQPIARL